MARQKLQNAADLGDYLAVALDETQVDSPLRMCVVLNASDGSTRPVLLRETLDARVMLGCVLDAASRVQQWLEVWIQDVSGYAATPAGNRSMMDNHLFDAAWKRRCASIARTAHSDIICGVWEDAHPLPLFVDPDKKSPIHPVDESSGQRWQLCQDDALLTQHNLPAFRTSLHRYLFVTNEDREAKFVPVTDGAPTNDNVIALDSIAPEGAIAINAGCGLMMVRIHEPLTYDSYVDLLSGGEPASNSTAAVFLAQLDDVAARSTSLTAGSSGRLFLGRQGRNARLIETLHLKLRAIADAVQSVRDFVEQTQAPILALNSERFRVSLGPAGCGLPTLWTARTVLGDPGEAVAVPFESTAHRYFLPPSQQPSIYQPNASTRSIQGRGSMRLRQLIDDGDNCILEGTFATNERIEPASGDLLWMRLPVSSSSGRMDVHATLDAQSALAAGEWRFRTHGRAFDAQQRAQLQQHEGVPMDNVLFDLVPLLSTPCDLYALAVLAVRTLLVDDQTTLAVALDEVHSLARQVATEYDGELGIQQRLCSVFECDDRWARGIGPQRLTREPLESDEAFAAIPGDLWMGVLAMIVRALPGIGPDSVFKDLGDVPSNALHRAFDGIRDDVLLLIERSRSLITAEWRSNREIHDVARQLLNGSGASEASQQVRA